MSTRVGMCLLMADIEPLKPSNTGWLVADAVVDTFAFGWTRKETDAALLELLADPQWRPYVVFPGEYVPAQRVVYTAPTQQESASQTTRPLFILLDATWAEARKMFRKSPYLDHFPVLSLEPSQRSRYALRRSHREDQFCTSEVAALCLALAGEDRAASTLDAYLDVYTHHYLRAKQQLPVQREGFAYERWRAMGGVLPQTQA